MDSQNSRNRFLKLSLRKNKIIKDKYQKHNRSSDVIVIDESFDKLKADAQCNNFQHLKEKNMKIYSPIIINDSCESSLNEESSDKVIILSEDEPSKYGNVSFNSTKQNFSPKIVNDSCLNEVSFNSTKQNISSKIINESPSIGGWSPAQNIICVSPRQESIPSTPNDVINQSYEECSLKQIQRSQTKLLNALYSNTLKSLPKLIKHIAHNNVDAAKKLNFNEDGNESDKENIRHVLKENKKLYLTNSDAKSKFKTDFSDTEKKSKKKLYTEKVPCTPDPPKPKLIKTRNVNSTSKKIKGKTITELVDLMSNDVDILSEKVKKVELTPLIKKDVNRLSFMASLAGDVPSYRMNIEAIQYVENFKTLKESLTRRLFEEFNRTVFDNAMDADLPILWDSKLRSTAGTTTNRLVKNAKGDRIRMSSIKLSSKVLDNPLRVRDTLIHELCHAATWLIDAELRAAHGPLWKKWAKKSLKMFPELGEISRCHEMEIHFKYTYKCTKCGYSIKRHSKSIDTTTKCCGYCRGQFELILNKKKKDGAVISTPARKGEVNGFALFVKENYSKTKDSTKNHAQVMKILGEQFSAQKSLQTPTTVAVDS